MKKFYIPYIVFCIILITLFIFKISTEDKKDEINAVPSPLTNYNENKEEKNILQENQDSDLFYVIRASENNIFLFDKNNKVIEKLNIDYMNLREYDKNLFLNGIKVDNMQDVYQLIEDFTN